MKTGCNICTEIKNLKAVRHSTICEGICNNKHVIIKSYFCPCFFCFSVCVCVCRRNLNYFSSAYTAAVSAVDPDAGHGELVIKIPSEIWKQGDGNILVYYFIWKTSDFVMKYV